MATLIKIKRVYDAYSDTDGIRILVDKLWPRGIKKETLHYDIWEKDLAPTPLLRQWFHKDIIKHWSQFQSLYEQELQQSEKVKDFIKTIEHYPLITLLYSAKDQIHNHVVILKSFLEQEIKH